MTAGGQTTVALSVSDSPDLQSLGLSDGHLRDAVRHIATQLLAGCNRLSYGGDLRPGGFTEILGEPLRRYRGTGAGVTNYLAWPVHAGMETGELADGVPSGCLGDVRVTLLDLDGAEVHIRDHKRAGRPPTGEEWSVGLTAMRRVACAGADALVALGGKTDRYKGVMPGVAEEVLLALEARKPVFLLGGFGGCACGIAETMGLVMSRGTLLVRSETWDSGEFTGYGHASLLNGLRPDENNVLAETAHAGQAASLILRGLGRLAAGDSIGWGNGK